MYRSKMMMISVILVKAEQSIASGAVVGVVVLQRLVHVLLGVAEVN